MYLIHFQVIDLVAPRLGAALRWATLPVFVTLAAAVVVVTLALAAAQYRFYEHPFLRLKSRFTPPRQALDPRAA
jgi:peptidoglycan/LPS O-acetylase OafA/YrhL